jgi:hypothetical protein
MDRLQVINQLIQQKELHNYLEIGVFNGHVFFRVESGFKVAVDPEFQFDWWRKFGKILVNPLNISNQYFQKTSDEFFAVDAEVLFKKRKIQIALIDGMHECDFVLRDVENVLKYLDENGVIVLHDCNPQNRESAVPAIEWKLKGSKGIWNGDVWKAILKIRSSRPDLTAFVLDCDHGLGVVVKQPSPILSYSAAEIDDFTFDDFKSNRNHWLNLQPAEYLYDFFGLRTLTKASSPP